MIFLYLAFYLNNLIHLNTNQHFLPFFICLVRHKCGPNAAQGRTKFPDLCDTEHRMRPAAHFFISVCSEVFCSPLPSIENSCHRTFLFSKCMLFCVTKHFASYHSCRAKHHCIWLSTLIV